MDLVVVDDSEQKKPSRPGMGPLVAVGGLHVPSAHVKSLEWGLEDLCSKTGFSLAEEFKWSPDKKTWMRRNLHGAARGAFFGACLDLAADAGATAHVIIEDKKRKPAEPTSTSHEEDVVKLFLERTDNHLKSMGNDAIVLADHPSGGRKAETQFVAGCIETLKTGTRFVQLDHVALVTTGDSKTARLLQLADLVVGCTLSCVSGETAYGAPLFDAKVKPLLREEMGRIGGVGLKIHPDLLYANLYYWLLGDKYLVRGMTGSALPTASRSYAESENAQ